MKTTRHTLKSAVTLVAFAMALLTSCSAPDISFSTTFEGVGIISLTGNGEATIDWGDDSAVQTVPLTSVEGGYTRIEHIFETEDTKNVAINGDIVEFIVDDHLPMTSLDVSRITGLTELHCPNCELTSLDVSKNTLLTVLRCGSNELTSLDVSKNTALTYLDCDYNELASLDVSKNTLLTRLHCGSNDLISLDVSKNTKLTDLEFADNPGDESGDFHVTVSPDGFPGMRIDRDFTITPWEIYDGSVVTPHYHAR